MNKNNKMKFKASKEGYCSICGNYSKLTRDHIPPQGCVEATSLELQTLSQYLGLAEKARKAYAHRFSRATKTDKMQRKAAKARKNLAPIKIHVPKSPYRTAIIREFLPTIWRQTVRRKSMGKISGTSTMGTI